MMKYKSTDKDWERSKGILNRLKRLRLIREIKNKAIELQDYESASWIRDIEKEINAYFLYEDDEGIKFLFELVDKRLEKLKGGQFKSYLISLLREYKIEKLLDNKKPS